MDGLVRQALDDAEAAYIHDRVNRMEALRDLQFIAADDQWDAADRKAREDAGRPCLTVNLLIAPVKQIINDIRMATPSVKCAPVDGRGDVKTASVLAGHIRQIQRSSRASWVYAMATGHAAMCGIGHFRIETRYAAEDTFDQEVALSLIPHPLAVLWDPASVKPDRSDAKFCLVMEFMPRADYERQYPEASKADFLVQGASLGGQFSWYRDDLVVVAEYWRKIPKKKKIGMTREGGIIDLSDIATPPEGMQIVRTRDVMAYDVEQTLVSGMEQLTETVKWPGRHIPIIPVIGNEIPLESRMVRHGMVRFARDPQRMHNYWRSSSAEWIQQGPKAPYLATSAQIGPYKELWDTANKTPRPYLLYDIDEDNPQAKPYREQPPMPPSAFWQEGEITAGEIRATTGMHEASMGQKSNETSAKAINARKLEGDMTNFEYADNLEVSLAQAGEVLVDLIPAVYDTYRTIRILDEEEREQFIPINAQAYAEDGEPVLVHDLSAGKYDVSITLGASQETRRAAATEAMIEFTKSSPDLFAVTADIIAESMDWPLAKRFAERVKRTIPPEILGPEAEPQEPDPMAKEAAKLTLMEQNAEVEKKTADAELKRAKAARERSNISVDRQKARQEADDNSFADIASFETPESATGV